MEPRPHERGNKRPDAVYRAQTHASMEPRPHERGNKRSLPNYPYAVAASMEPRPHERGNAAAPLPVGSTSTSFNGATSSRTWKRRAAHRPPVRIHHASM